MSDGREFVKTLFNAKTQAEEFYRDPLVEWKPVVYESQLESMSGFYNDEAKWAKTRAWIEEHFDVVDDQLRREEMLMSWKRIHQMLDEQYYNRINLIGIAPQRGGKTWLGSQIEQRERERLQRGNRVAEMREVPGIRGLGYSTDQAWIDEAYYSTEIESGPTYRPEYEEGHAALEEWLQRRSICHRASSCGLA